MDDRLRLVGRLLDGDVMSDVCRDFGISRKAGDKIFARHKDQGVEALCDRSRRPVRYANQVPPQIETQIVTLKQEKPHWGARKIRERLVRRLNGDIRMAAKSTIHAVLHRHGRQRDGFRLRRFARPRLRRDRRIRRLHQQLANTLERDPRQRIVRARCRHARVRRPPAAQRRRDVAVNPVGRSWQSVLERLLTCASVGPLRRLGRLVFGFLLERLPDGFIADETLFVRRFLTRRIEARLAVRNLGDWFLLAHRSPFFS